MVGSWTRSWGGFRGDSWRNFWEEFWGGHRGGSWDSPGEAFGESPREASGQAPGKDPGEASEEGSGEGCGASGDGNFWQRVREKIHFFEKMGAVFWARKRNRVV